MVKSENRNKITIFLIAAAVIFSFWFTGFSLPKLISRGSQFFVIIGKMFPPDINYLGKIISPLLETIKMSFAGTFIGSLLALIVAPFCAYILCYADTKCTYAVDGFLCIAECWCR